MLLLCGCAVEAGTESVISGGVVVVGLGAGVVGEESTNTSYENETFVL